MGKRLVNLALLAYLAATGGLFLTRVDAWGRGLTDTTTRVLSALDTPLRGASLGGEIIECMCAPGWSASGMEYAGLAVLLAGAPLAVLARWTRRRRTPLEAGTLYLACGIQCMNWALSIPIGLGMLPDAVANGTVWIHWFPLIVGVNIAIGPPAISSWRARLVDAISRRPALLALR